MESRKSKCSAEPSMNPMGGQCSMKIEVYVYADQNLNVMPSVNP